MDNKCIGIQEIKKNYIKQLQTPSIQRAVHCIHKHLFDRRLTVRWLKEQCHINSKSFSALFKDCLGWYPKEYIVHHRIKASKLLLEQIDESITGIALEVGYFSLSAYCNAFKKREEMRPSEWR